MADSKLPLYASSVYKFNKEELTLHKKLLYSLIGINKYKGKNHLKCMHPLTNQSEQRIYCLNALKIRIYAELEIKLYLLGVALEQQRQNITHVCN